MMSPTIRINLLLVLILCGATVRAQPGFYLGADLSYVNEMEDCGVRYEAGGLEEDPYTIFADAGANLVRLRIWHNPRWYDDLNDGNRYGDLADVKRSIARAKASGMSVLLDFHLSDTWTDPSRQIVPAAWAGVTDNLSVLEDSLYNYIHATLLNLNAGNLMPEMVQIGNETNKGILQSAEDDAAGWALDWPRNAALFNRAIAAVRDVEVETGKNIGIAIHIAGPTNAGWLLEGFEEHGVTDFDVIGLSYYWAWHQPTTIGDAGDIVERLKADYPGKEVMIFETGYIWTTESNDTANNIISSVQPGYAPASPNNQKRWLVDLTQEMIRRGAAGVIYWEPAWVSSPCRTQWGQGSHQEHAAFFDFTNNVLPDGGMGFYAYNYDGLVSHAELPAGEPPVSVLVSPGGRALEVTFAAGLADQRARLQLVDLSGRVMLRYPLGTRGAGYESVPLPELPAGVYVVKIDGWPGNSFAARVLLLQE
ncbi:arabinogalactan endo-1,4-beta-galactosidase [Neolewinella aurantiaca]|uniref:Arabinogalactan endo-beta-1,4-galactanase n=1 Tax=Neolewinella aurantiaca TaxID=2602767 RepID=A0A5C7F7Q2_9BACT|nr:glycosyl hydrolase 53 family protein [Neolewinella aurantiaca]TXF86691.1 arabinogalactan endo-1,4-beta-galactosidase [Neolewinella aurantiaca]